MLQFNENKTRYYANLLIVLTLAVLILYVGKFIIFPLVFSFFSALALLPIVTFLQKLKFSKLWSCLSTVLLICIVIGSFVIYLSYESYELINDLSENTKLTPSSIIDTLISKFKTNVDSQLMEDKKTMESITEKAVSSSGEILSYILNSLKSTFVFISLVPIYIFFMLFYKDNFKLFIEKSFSKSQKKEQIEMIREIKKMVQKYLLGLSLVVLIIIGLNTIGLLSLGIKHAFLIGAVTGVLIVIPYIGVFIGALIPITIALLTKDSVWYAVGVLAIYTFIQFLEGNYITPSIVGNSVNLNPLIIIIGIIVLGSIGGILAMIIAVPLIASIKIFFDHSKTNNLNILMAHKREEE